MSKFDDSLRGYGFDVFERDGFKCRYCGADGTKSFDTWLTLSVDHLLLKDNKRRENIEFKVTACNFCNTADNRYLERQVSKNFNFDTATVEELMAERWKAVQETRLAYKAFWLEKVVTPSTK